MNFYAARHPILDKNKDLFAYELLFRDSIVNVFPDIDGDEATSKMIEASQFNMGISEFTGNKPAFINFTLETLSRGYPDMIEPSEIIIEILETVKPGKELLGLCKKLHNKGYTLALDDYEHKSVWLHFFPYVKIIKIDIQLSSIEEIKEIIALTKEHPHIKLLAEKVETHEEYQQMLQLNFDYFQGYFFAKPEMIKTKTLSPSQIAISELLCQTCKEEIDINEVIQIFERDVSLSYKLLRYANSAIFKRRTEISTIKQALVSLGKTELSLFIGLLFTTTANPSTPSELINLSMTRAKFCELIAHELSLKDETSIAFLTGLLSMIDAILNEDMSVILEKLPLSEKIKSPLMTNRGNIASIITLVKFIEQAQWDDVTIAIESLHIDKDDVIKCYNQAVTWADEQIYSYN